MASCGRAISLLGKAVIRIAAPPIAPCMKGGTVFENAIWSWCCCNQSLQRREGGSLAGSLTIAVIVLTTQSICRPRATCGKAPRCHNWGRPATNLGTIFGWYVTHTYNWRPIHQASYGQRPVEDIGLPERPMDLAKHNKVPRVVMSNKDLRRCTMGTFRSVSESKHDWVPIQTRKRIFLWTTFEFHFGVKKCPDFAAGSWSQMLSRSSSSSSVWHSINGTSAQDMHTIACVLDRIFQVKDIHLVTSSTGFGQILWDGTYARAAFKNPEDMQCCPTCVSVVEDRHPFLLNSPLYCDLRVKSNACITSKYW